MIARFKEYWAERSRREQSLLAVMAALLAIVILWLGLARPVEAGLRDARAAASQAADRNAAIRVKVAALSRLPAGGPPAVANLPQTVSQSAGEAGFTLDRAQPQGTDRLDIAIASARPTALFGWLAALEGQGIAVETLTIRPAALSGTIAVQAVLKASRP